MVPFISRRSTIQIEHCRARAGFAPLESVGSFCLIVCSITRGPANTISAPGSAMLRSPSIAKLAVTPPVVGSVSTESRECALSSLASAAHILPSA